MHVVQFKMHRSTAIISFAAPSSAPVNMTISDIKSTEFLLTWTAPPYESHNGIITEYVVNITEVETGDMYKLVSQTASIIVQSLHAFYSYECTVSAVTVAEGPYTEAVTARTLEDGMCDTLFIASHNY